MSLIVVVGLVLGISGSAYSAIMALRSCWEDRVKDHAKDVAGWQEELQQAPTQSLKDSRDKHLRRNAAGLKTWDRAQWAPMFLLGLASLLMTGDVIWLDWHEGEIDFFKHRPEYWCDIYKWGMVFIILVDVVALVMTYLAYGKICDSAQDLKHAFANCVSHRTIAKTQSIEMASPSPTPPKGTPVEPRPLLRGPDSDVEDPRE